MQNQVVRYFMPICFAYKYKFLFRPAAVNLIFPEVEENWEGLNGWISVAQGTFVITFENTNKFGKLTTELDTRKFLLLKQNEM
ncbi:hypothetical protein M3Y98_00893700 [Aphelenchoides besseyi]|nr:hypothetical protein M3Y98_00893700 [Aphelenchoides besseyi]